MWPSEIEEFIGGIELWKGLTGEELRLLIDCFEVKTFGPDSLLFEENSPRSELFVVVEGEVELFKTNSFEEERRLSVFRGGDFLGESSLVDDSPHSTSARTLKETRALVLSRNVFRGLVKENGSIALKVFPQVARVISRRMHQANTRVVTAGAQYESGRTRTEYDLLGEREVPDEVYYGVQTLRAQENFDITGVNLSHFPVLIKALAMVKMVAARANHDLGLLPTPVADAIAQACREIVNGRHHYNFVVDMIQGGAGTSTNMNANEVIANRALEILGYDKGDYEHCHPNNHVNLSQSTNDVYPTAVKIALIDSNGRLVQVLHGLVDALRGKGREFSRVLKMGRTHLQDAVPMTLGQEFEAYAVTMGEEIQRLEENARLFLEVNMGGTAIGTGITADPEYGGRVIEHLREITGLDLVLAPDLVEQTQDTGAFVMYSSTIKRLAVKLSKISNDLRLLSSGPRAGIHEINLLPVQPGSSIMPGKVNPVIPEVVNQIAFKVIGNDLTVTLAAEAGQLQLNVMEPVITQSLFESIEMLERGMQTLTNRCIEGITANEERARRMVEGSIGLVTALVPVLGYEACSRLAREAMDEGRGIYELVLERELLSKEELDRLLDPENMFRPRKL